jgi:hypothetical protein
MTSLDEIAYKSNPLHPNKARRVIKNNFSPIGGDDYNGLVVGELLPRDVAEKKFSMWKPCKRYHAENIPMKDLIEKLSKELKFKSKEPSGVPYDPPVVIDSQVFKDGTSLSFNYFTLL